MGERIEGHSFREPLCSNDDVIYLITSIIFWWPFLAAKNYVRYDTAICDIARLLAPLQSTYYYNIRNLTKMRKTPSSLKGHCSGVQGRAVLELGSKFSFFPIFSPQFFLKPPCSEHGSSNEITPTNPWFLHLFGYIWVPAFPKYEVKCISNAFSNSPRSYWLHKKRIMKKYQPSPKL